MRQPTITIDFALFKNVLYMFGYRVSVHKDGEVFLRRTKQSKRSKRWAKGPISFYPIRPRWAKGGK